MADTNKTQDNVYPITNGVDANKEYRHDKRNSREVHKSKNPSTPGSVPKK